MERKLEEQDGEKEAGMEGWLEEEKGRGLDNEVR